MAPRYREASSDLKSVILDEFVAATGYARKYAIRLLCHPGEQKMEIKRPRAPAFRPRSSTGAPSSLDGGEPDLCEAVDPVPAHSGGFFGTAWTSPFE
jgi:hypothetical protein